MMKTGIQRRGFESTRRRSKRQVVTRTPWQTTSRSSCLLPCKTGTGLPANSINSWGDLCAKVINNFQGTFTKPGVKWDLSRIHQKKGESLREFMRWFIKKKDSIPSVNNAVVMAAFRKGVKDPDLLKKISRKQPRTVKELFDMADRYANQEDTMVK